MVRRYGLSLEASRGQMVERKMVSDCLAKGLGEGLKKPGYISKWDFETRGVAVGILFNKHLKHFL